MISTNSYQFQDIIFLIDSQLESHDTTVVCSIWVCYPSVGSEQTTAGTGR